MPPFAFFARGRRNEAHGALNGRLVRVALAVVRRENRDQRERFAVESLLPGLPGGVAQIQIAWNPELPAAHTQPFDLGQLVAACPEHHSRLQRL